MLGLFIGSCDLLKPRDSQLPNQGTTANPPANDPKTVITNLEASFANKNVNDYEKIFSDTGSVGKSYVFVPTQKAAGVYSAIFSHWTVESEINYFNKATKSASIIFPPVVTTVEPWTTTTYHSDSALIELDYKVFLSPTTYSGHSRFYLLPNKNTGIWVMYRWEDLQSSPADTLTWSDMKGQIGQ